MDEVVLPNVKRTLQPRGVQDVINADSVIVTDLHKALFTFIDALSGREKLGEILRSDNVKSTSKFNSCITFYCGATNRSEDIYYYDLMHYQNKLFITSNIVNVYFTLLNINFET